MSYANLCLRYISCLAFLLFTSYSSFAQPPCECTNCPVTIVDNGSFDGILDVTVAGPNNLGLCPLERICFQVNHTWVGDLSATLTSPFGLHYIIMGDSNNGTGGCGLNADNIDICIDVGTGNPVTNNTDYVCNGGAACLEGNWTVACGGVTDPVNGALQAPTCDLDDFNVMGHPANGSWILTINDICDNDVGNLVTWTLDFACGTVACITCEPEGGELNQEDVSGCQFSNDLNLSVNPVYNGANVMPDPVDYGYTYVIVNQATGLITGIQPTANMSTALPGDYQVCGLSFAYIDAAAIFGFLNTPYAALELALASGAPPFCGDLSDNCFEVSVAELPLPQVEFVDMCVGDCYTYPGNGQEYCTFGSFPVTLQSEAGCDSLVNLIITPLPISYASETKMICEGGTYSYGGEEYSEGIHTIEETAFNGCDSVITLILLEFMVDSDIGVIGDDSISCVNPTVELTSLVNYTDGQLQWFDNSGALLGDAENLTVSNPGCYDLVVSRDSAGLFCQDTAQFCVGEILYDVIEPQLNGLTLLCVGDTVTYTSSVLSDYIDYIWNLPSDVDILNGGNGEPFVEVVWNSIFTGDICVQAVTDCGLSDPVCLPVDFEFTVDAPSLTGATLACDGDVNFYSAYVAGADSYIWTVSGGTILSGQNTDNVQVEWGASGGDICVNAVTYCGTSPSACLEVFPNFTPTLAEIVGSDTLCAGGSYTFTATIDSNTDSCFWSVDPCMDIISPQGDPMIEISVPLDCAGGTICVETYNVCGAGATDCFDIFAIQEPVVENPIGPSSICPGSTSFYVPPVVGALSYSWTSDGGTVTSGQGSEAAELNFATSGTYQVCIDVETACFNMGPYCSTIEILELVGTPVITGEPVICPGGSAQYFVDEVANAVSYEWTSSCGNITSGQGSNLIDHDWSACASGGEVCVRAIGLCDTSAIICFDVGFEPTPVAPVLDIPSTLCSMDTVSISASTIDTNIVDFDWQLPTCATLISGAGTNTIQLVFDASCSIVDICLSTSNGCEYGPQVCESVEVLAPPVVGNITGSDIICIEDEEIYTIPVVENVNTYNWTVSGGQITSGQGTNSITVEWEDNGNQSICLLLSGVCSDIVVPCYDVFVQANMIDPQIDGDAVVCDSTTTTYSILSPIPEAIQYTWTSTCGIITSGQGTEVIEIDWTGCPAVNAQVCVTANGPCDDSAEVCFDVTGTTNPGPVLINGNTTACLTDEMVYCANSENALEFNWLVNGGTIVSGAGTDCINVIWDSEGTGQVCLQTTNDCGASAQVCMDVLVDDNPVAPGLTGALISCIDESQSYTMTTADDDITAIEWSIPSGCGVIGNGQGTAVVNIDWMSAGSCEVCVRISNECGFSDLTCIDVDVIAIPAPVALEDGSICGMDYELSATTGAGAISWSAVGPGNAVFSAEDQASTTVTVSEFGTYTFTVEVDDNGCIGSDELVVDFFESPSLLSSPVESCDATGSNYTITFEITNGSGPYYAVGLSGTWSGNSFTSDPISSTSPYSLEVFDSNDCGPVLIEGTYECPCTSDAGNLAAVDLVLCAGETDVLALATGMVLDGDDTYTYFVLDAAPTATVDPSTVVYSNLSGLISYQAGMNFDQTYYMLLAVGNELNGIVDLSDPCLSVTTVSSFLFKELPEANFATTAQSVCEGDIATVYFDIDAQVCVDIILESDGGVQYTLNCVSDGDSFDLPNTTAGVYTYEIISVQEDGLCFGATGSSFELTVNSIPELEIQSTASVCNSTDTGMSTSIDLSDYLIQGSGSLIWTNMDACPFTGTLPIIDLDGVSPGEYQFACQTNSAIDPCADPTVYITLTVENCVCPDLSVQLPSTFCNSSANFILDDYLNDDSVEVNWSLGDIPVQGDYLAANINGASVSLNGSAPGSYEFLLEFAGTAPVGCVLNNSIEFELSDQLYPGLETETLRICEGENDVISLADLLSDEDNGGVWSEQSLIMSTGGAFSAGLGQFAVSNQTAGVYTFNYEVDSDEPCQDLSTEVNVQIDALPAAIVQEYDTITCVNLEVQLTAYEEDGYVFEWANQNNLGQIIGESSGIVVDTAGIYQLQVVDSGSGCSDQAVVDVQAYLEVPIPDLEADDVGCHGETNGSILIQSISGGTAPYLVSLDEGVYSDNMSYGNLAPGVYNLAIEDAFGCVSYSDVEIVEPAPLGLELDIDYSSLENEAVGIGDSVEIFGYLNTPIEDIDQVQWSPANLVDCDTCLSVLAFPTESTTLSVKVNVGSCSVREYVQVLVKKDYPVFIPNVVSFNNDGVNDILYVFGGEEVSKINYFRIFDRWGEEIFLRSDFPPNNPDYGWNGEFSGKRVNSGTYVYVVEVEFVDGRVEVLKGDVSVLN